MKKYLISLVIISSILTAYNSYSQSGWIWHNPVPSNKTLSKTQFVNSTTGFTIINYRIFKTTNGGNNWYIPGDTIGHYYYKFLDETTGFTLFNYAIYKTNNSGINWNLFQSLISLDVTYTGLDFLNQNTGFYTFTIFSPFGPFGHIAYTTNGGINWANPYYPEPEYFSDIKILSLNYAYAVGVDSGKVYLYKSFGPTSSWFRVPTGLLNSYSANLFVKDTAVVYVTAGDIVLCSKNGGYDWFNTGLSEIKDIKFTNQNTGIAVGKNHKIYRSTNGGMNWNNITSPVNYNFHSVSFGNQSTGYITGELGSVLKTSDYGQTWSTNCSYFTLKSLSDVRFLGRDTVVITADSGYIYRTTNQGLNWTGEKVGNNSLSKFFFLNKTTGYACGAYGLLLKTTNSGVNWNSLNTGISDRLLLDVFFLNQNTGFIATAIPGNLYKTTNGGLNWFNIPKPENANYFFIRFLNTNTGFTSAFENIYRTTDLGETWTLMNTHINADINWDICFINNLTGFTANGDGYIHKSTDGGYNWFRTSELVSNDVFKVHFLNETTGYATAGYGFSGSFSAIFCTTNGGANWLRQYIPMGTNAEKLSSVDFCDMNTGFVVGYNGIVFKTTTGGMVYIKSMLLEIPELHSLYQNYPNPFNPITNIKFDLPKNGFVTLKLFDILGREIATLVDEILKSGTYNVSWNGSDYPSGVYFYKMIAGDYNMTKKMLLIK